MIEDINWVYVLHSQLRHPGTNAQQLETMLCDPWPDAEAERLDVAAGAADGVLTTFKVAFGLGNGWETDIDEKVALAEFADTHWSAARRLV